MTSNKNPLDRRDFLKTASVAGLGALATSRGVGPLLAFDGPPAEQMAVAKLWSREYDPRWKPVV